MADCVLLFGYHRLDVFPVDVWIARAVSRYFMGGRNFCPGRQESSVSGALALSQGTLRAPFLLDKERCSR